jgi:signal transduction histidine kinase
MSVKNFFQPKSLYTKIILLSLVAAIGLGAITFVILLKISDFSEHEQQNHLFLFIANSIETRQKKEGILAIFSEGHDGTAPPPLVPPLGNDTRPILPQAFPRMHFPPPGPGPEFPRGEWLRNRPPPRDDDEMGPPRSLRRHSHMPGPDLWLVSESNERLSDNNPEPLPLALTQIPKPKKMHEVSSDDSFFHLKAGTSVMRLDTTPVTFLVARDGHRPSYVPFIITQAVLMFLILLVALSFTLLFTFLYLRKKSDEARTVLLRLEQGDLKARFRIQKFDEFGSLLLDFNRMAGEIERLVNRVRQSESTRSRLIQELGHDLRTPLTSLMTSFENFKFFSKQMAEEDKVETLATMGDEIAYLTDLLNKLTEIATLEEPHYKKSAVAINLYDLLNQEMKNRNTSTQNHVEWVLQGDAETHFLGDEHLLLRLFRNAFDNAARFAKNRVEVVIEIQDRTTQIRARDDGPGLSDDDLQQFGKRREKRLKREGSQLHYSLGLGSMIMKSIVELHGGTVEIKNVIAAGKVVGAELVIQFTK